MQEGEADSSLYEAVLMKKVNTNNLEPLRWGSPKGTFAGEGIQVSEALGRKRDSTDLLERHPFDVEILRVPPGKPPYPYHSHTAQWEFYHVISGSGKVRHADGTDPIVVGDAFVFKPGEPHGFFNDGPAELVMYVVADNPIGEYCYYPDSKKWGVRHPQRELMRAQQLDYYDGEE